jgi:hypothetical protein
MLQDVAHADLVQTRIALTQRTDELYELQKTIGDCPGALREEQPLDAVCRVLEFHC